jgi:YVTN family beta-propeller protein
VRVPSVTKAKLFLVFATVVSSACATTEEPAARCETTALPAPQTNSKPSVDSRGQAPSSLDYDVYRSRIEPVFLKMRESGVRCYDCHATLVTRLRLEPLSPGSSLWMEGQSRKNFEAVSQLVTPGDPLKSRLLLHPLAQEAGGDPTHSGGKFWTSQNDPEWQMIAGWVLRGSPGVSAGQSASRSTSTSEALDFQRFKSNVQPIFLKERLGHARCYGCHSESNRFFRLQTLSPGAADWTEEQSRQNFQNALQLVSPGDPSSSTLLVHPLAPDSGGDPFHSGGRQFQSQNDPDWIALADWVRGSRTAADPKLKPPALIYITNSAADTIDVVDPVTNKVVQVIRGIELPHGVNFSPDGARVYVSNESESVLDVVDRVSGEITKKVALSARPNNITVTKDGRRVLVGIRTLPGAVDVIDTSSLSRVKTIPVNRSVHNIYVTPDGRYAVVGSIESKSVTIIELTTDQIAWEVQFDRGVRPMAFETNPDGSTSRIFVQLSGFHGFAVVDFAKRDEVARISLPDQPGGFGVVEGRTGTPSHGIGVAPDGKSLWVNSTLANSVFEYSLPELNVIGYSVLPVVHPFGDAPTGAVPEWITFTPDSRTVYVSNSAARSVSAIDTKTLKSVAVIPAGEVPKRINTLVLH